MVAKEINGMTFSARKVVMSREYFVQAVTPDGTKCKIGPFKYKGRAQDWIERHASTWSPGETNTLVGFATRVKDKSLAS
jgi:hypothetical protein